MKHKVITKILSLMVVLCFSTASIGVAADSAVSGFGAVTTVGDSDLLLISYWTGSAFQSKKITFANFKTAVGTGSGIGNGTAYQVYHTKSDASAGEWTSTLGATGTRLTKGWFTALEVTNDITIGGNPLATIYQPLDSTLTGLAGLAITVDGNNVTFPGSVITTAADGSRVISVLNNTSSPSLSANTYGWYFYGEVPYINVDGVSKPAVQKVCKTITNPSDADNVLFHIAAAGTITKISGICVGGTSAVITLQDAGADGSGSTSIDDAITIDTDGANGGTISYAVHDGDIIKLDVGTVTGVVTQLMVCYE